jgi:serine/threonine protein kinase/tetratricopeptide (TPR) repeat protein
MAAQDIDQIFWEAVQIAAPDQRAAYLDRVCAGDAGLRERVEQLLQARAQAASFLEAPAPNPLTTVQAVVREGPGTIIGPYKLLQQIGEGGFGVVFMAEQMQPVRRTVALKVIKPGMDTAQVIARFESERQALALMDHPHIAKVLDAGATESGRPYFVMELVKGVPITEFCDRNHLPPEARLRLFLDVCHAIQHAHHKGVIHRDIKPSNVLVTLHDGVPVVKVIDFGVAKATAQKLTEKTLFTVYGQMIGTPAYMSPEQAELSGLDIDTRSDVYALGVLLYELLTGTTPLDVKRLRAAGYAEMQRLIREEEAPRPSARLSSLGGSATILAGNRGLEVRRLVQLLAGDLDWVVMKALDKDRNRRYGTPGSFAEDVERYLRREAILARPPSSVYKLRKFAQRNRVAVLTALAVAAALLLGMLVATWQAVRAIKAEATAVASAEAERQAKDEALAREAETKAVLNFVENKVFAAARPEGEDGGLGHDVTLRRALAAALPFVAKSFLDQPLIEARLRMTLAASFYLLGEGETAAEQVEAARALYAKHKGPDDPDTLRSMSNLALIYHDLGRHTEALALMKETLKLQKARLGADHPNTLASMNNLANSYYAHGRDAEAAKLHEEALALQKIKLGPNHQATLQSMGNLANSYYALGRHAEAIKLLEETLTLQKANLGPDHPDTLHNMNNLAGFYGTVGRHADALRLVEETLPLQKAKLGPDHRETLMSMGNLGNCYFVLGRYADALKVREEILARLKARPGPDHPYTLQTMGDLAENLLALDRGAEAVPLIDDCVRRAVGKVVPAEVLPGVMDIRLRHFAKAKDAAGCRQTAEMWEKLRRTDGASLVKAASMRAVTAAVLRATDRTAAGAKQADAEADRAMAWLKQAVAAGYREAAPLANDHDLDALRDRGDFQKLLAELKSSTAKQK